VAFQQVRIRCGRFRSNDRVTPQIFSFHSGMLGMVSCIGGQHRGNRRILANFKVSCRTRPGNQVQSRRFQISVLCFPVAGVNAVWLRNAVLCADCEVISDSPHDTCRICGSRSLLSLSGVLGGALPVQRAHLVESNSRPAFAVIRRMPHKRARHSVA
jgi:hypothetical protein